MLAEGAGEGSSAWSGIGFDSIAIYLERTGGMEFSRVMVSRCKSFSFCCVNVQDSWVIQVRHSSKQLYKGVDVVAVNGSEVWDIKALKHLACGQNHTDAFLYPFDCLFYAFSDDGHMFEDISGGLSQVFVGLAEPDL